MGPLKKDPHVRGGGQGEGELGSLRVQMTWDHMSSSGHHVRCKWIQAVFLYHARPAMGRRINIINITIILNSITIAIIHIIINIIEIMAIVIICLLLSNIIEIMAVVI